MDINSIDIVGERVDGGIDLYIVIVEEIEESENYRHSFWIKKKSIQLIIMCIADDFRETGFTDAVINDVMEQQYRMLDKLDVKYERIKY